MAYDNLTPVTDDLSDNLAEYQNEKKTAIEHVMSSSAYAAYTRTQSMTGNVTLTDSDFPIQSFSPTAARDLNLPAVASTNHAFYVVNRSATYEITVKNASAVVVGIVTQNSSLMVMSDGTNGWYVPGDNRDIWEEVASTPTTPPSGKWRVYFKSDGLYVVDDAGAATGPLGAGGGSGGGGFNEGFMTNGKLVPSVASNNLTLAIKTLAGTDPSAGDKVQIRIGNVIHEITSALSVTKNAATNWCNSGSAELATKEVDYFAYIGYNATDGITLGFSRIPYAAIYSDFSTTSTDEKYCAISTITNAAAGDDYVNVGRFAATLSAGAGYTWTVPTYTSKNLVQRPIFDSRELSYVPTWTGFSTAPNGTWTYQVRVEEVHIFYNNNAAGTSNATTCKFTLPFLNKVAYAIPCFVSNNGTNPTTPGVIWAAAGSKIVDCYLSWPTTAFTASGGKNINLSYLVVHIA